MAYRSQNTFIVSRFAEPGLFGEEVQDVEEHRAGGAGSDEPGGCGAGGVPRLAPRRYGRGHTAGPSVPVSVAGPRLPGCSPC